MEKSDKKYFKDKKEKKAYITWEDNDMDSSIDSKNEIINLGMVHGTCIFSVVNCHDTCILLESQDDFQII